MKQTTNHPTTTWAAVNATILSTMEFLTSDEQLRSSDDAQQPDPVREAAIAYLQEHLNLSRIQVLILTSVLYYSAKHSGRKCDMDDLANLLHMHPLRVLQLREEFCALDELGYIVNYQNKDGWSLSMVGEALESLAMDIPFDPQILKLENNFDFLCKAHQGIFYDGQIFDAYTFINDRIREATTRIILFDNYIDDSVLTILSKRADKVAATIYTKKPTAQLQLDIQKHNAQYTPIDIITFDRSHDRFLCIDETVYHLGASIKDLGKKWFAFNRMEMPASELLQKI